MLLREGTSVLRLVGAYRSCVIRRNVWHPAGHNSRVLDVAHPLWCPHSIGRLVRLSTLLADVFGRRQGAACLELQGLLQPFGMTQCDTEGWGAYERRLDSAQHVGGEIMWMYGGRRSRAA